MACLGGGNFTSGSICSALLALAPLFPTIQGSLRPLVTIASGFVDWEGLDPCDALL